MSVPCMRLASEAVTAGQPAAVQDASQHAVLVHGLLGRYVLFSRSS